MAVVSLTMALEVSWGNLAMDTLLAVSGAKSPPEISMPWVVEVEGVASATWELARLSLHIHRLSTPQRVPPTDTRIRDHLLVAKPTAIFGHNPRLATEAKPLSSDTVSRATVRRVMLAPRRSTGSVVLHLSKDMAALLKATEVRLVGVRHLDKDNGAVGRRRRRLRATRAPVMVARLRRRRVAIRRTEDNRHTEGRRPTVDRGSMDRVNMVVEAGITSIRLIQEISLV
jgi:hypothetical protein